MDACVDDRYSTSSQHKHQLGLLDLLYTYITSGVAHKHLQQFLLRRQCWMNAVHFQQAVPLCVILLIYVFFMVISCILLRNLALMFIFTTHNILEVFACVLNIYSTCITFLMVDQRLQTTVNLNWPLNGGILGNGG